MENATLEVTRVQVYPVSWNEKIKAVVRVVISDQLQLTGLQVREGTSGLFVSYPSDPTYKGEDYRQIFYPIAAKLRNEIEQAVLTKYRTEYLKMLENQNKENT